MRSGLPADPPPKASAHRRPLTGCKPGPTTCSAPTREGTRTTPRSHCPRGTYEIAARNPEHKPRGAGEAADPDEPDDKTWEEQERPGLPLRGRGGGRGQQDRDSHKRDGEKQAGKGRRELSKGCTGRKNTVRRPEEHRTYLKIHVCEVRSEKAGQQGPRGRAREFTAGETVRGHTNGTAKWTQRLAGEHGVT